MININEAHNTGRTFFDIEGDLISNDIEYRIIYEPVKDVICKIGDIYFAIHFDDEWVAL